MRYARLCSRVSGVVGCADAAAPFDCPTANGGQVTLNTNGRFTFRPAAGSTAAYSFQYVLTDNGIPAPASSNVSVSLTFVGNRIWFGIYMHANHHKHTSYFNPTKMVPSLPIEPAGG